MNTHKVTQIFIGNGSSALPANNTQISAAAIGRLGIFGNDMLALNPAGGDTISTAGADSIQIFEKLANGDLKKSQPIKGLNVTGWKGQSYTAATRKVHAIGHNRATTTGTIEVANSTVYKATIRFTNDKEMYSERPEVLSISFTSSAAATQSNIADQIVSAINNSAFGTGVNKQILSVKVGDGTGAYGLTGATDFGVEIWGLNISQSDNQYAFKQVSFQVFVDDASGFGATTTSASIQSADPGVGTYSLVYNQERFSLGYEGALNRRLWPVPTLATQASNAFFASAAITPTATITTGEDTVTFSASVVTSATDLKAGDFITIDAVAYEIKYFVSSTVAVLTTVALATGAGLAVIKKYQYDIFSIEFTDVVTSPGANVGAFAKKLILIATPAIDEGGTISAGTTMSTEGQDLEDILNGWMTSTPLAPLATAL